MIEQGLKLCQRIDLNCLKRNNWTLRDNQLINNDWQILAGFHNQPFKKKTMNLQSQGVFGSYSIAWKVLPTIYKLLKHAKDKQAKYLNTTISAYGDPENHHIFHSLTLRIKKLEKY